MKLRRTQKIVPFILGHPVCIDFSKRDHTCRDCARRNNSAYKWSAFGLYFSTAVTVNLHCVSKKLPTFKLSATLSNLNQFSKLMPCWKAYEVCYKTLTTLPTSPVAALPCEIKHSNFLQIFSRYGRKCKQIAF